MDNEYSVFKRPSVFIVSSGRSGTTLLVSMLNASNQIYIPYESDFISRAYPHYVDKNDFNESDYKKILSIFKMASQQNGWGMEDDYVLSQLKSRSPKSFAEVNAVICEAFHRNENTMELEWGIKAPVLIASLNRIKSVFPQAKIVHIVRDGRDVYLSYKKVNQSGKIKFGPRNSIENALYWVDGLRRIEEFKKHSRESLFELSYDDLLTKPEKTIEDLCRFLGIEFCPSMINNFNSFERNKKIAPSHIRKSIHQKLSGGLDPQNSKKYLSQLSWIEILRFEFIAAPYLLKYGYEPRFKHLSGTIFNPFRSFLYFAARYFNNYRYRQRDQKVYQKACEGS